MAKRRRVERNERGREHTAVDSTPLSFNPFASLSGVSGMSSDLSAESSEPAAPNPAPPAETKPETRDPRAASLESGLSLHGLRLVVRRQKKGQGGKTVTCIEGLSPALAVALLARAKRELGCSGRLDGALLIAGTRDHGRVADWLRRNGADRVTLGN